LDRLRSRARKNPKSGSPMGDVVVQNVEAWVVG